MGRRARAAGRAPATGPGEPRRGAGGRHGGRRLPLRQPVGQGRRSPGRGRRSPCTTWRAAWAPGRGPASRWSPTTEGRERSHDRGPHDRHGAGDRPQPRRARRRRLDPHRARPRLRHRPGRQGGDHEQPVHRRHQLADRRARASPQRSGALEHRCRLRGHRHRGELRRHGRQPAGPARRPAAGLRRAHPGGRRRDVRQDPGVRTPHGTGRRPRVRRGRSPGRVTDREPRPAGALRPARTGTDDGSPRWSPPVWWWAS